MRKEFEEIVKTLQIDDLATTELRKRVLTLCSDVDNARTIIAEMCILRIGRNNKSCRICTKIRDPVQEVRLVSGLE